MQPQPRSRRRGRARTVLLGCAAAVLFVLHQDYWFWDDRTLVFGFLPIGLAYHALFSIAAGILWGCAVQFAWPRDIEDRAMQTLPSDSPDSSP